MGAGNKAKSSRRRCWARRRVLVAAHVRTWCDSIAVALIKGAKECREKRSKALKHPQSYSRPSFLANKSASNLFSSTLSSKKLVPPPRCVFMSGGFCLCDFIRLEILSTRIYLVCWNERQIDKFQMSPFKWVIKSLRFVRSTLPDECIRSYFRFGGRDPSQHLMES